MVLSHNYFPMDVSFVMTLVCSSDTITNEVTAIGATDVHHIIWNVFEIFVHCTSLVITNCNIGYFKFEIYKIIW